MSENSKGGSARNPRKPAVRFLFFIVIFLIITAIYVAFHLFIAWIFIMTFSLKGDSSSLIYITSVFIGLFTIIAQIVSHFYHGRPVFPIYLLSSLLIGMTLYAFLTSLAVGLILIPCHITGIWSNWTYLPYVLRGILAGGIIIPVLAGLVNARSLRIRRIEIPMKNLHSEPVKVVFVSDLHLGLLVGRRRLERIISALMSERPDLVLIGGDLYDTRPRNIAQLTEILKRIPIIAPTYAVTGNHEFINGIDECVSSMKEIGFNVLRGRAVMDKKTDIQIIGVDDSSGQSPFTSTGYSLNKLMAELDPGKPIIFLNHSPLDFLKVRKLGISLELSGHTHGGQLWPLGYITRLIYKDGDRGLITRGSSHLYVSTGAGTWGPPLRLGTSSEISILNLISCKKEKK